MAHNQGTGAPTRHGIRSSETRNWIRTHRLGGVALVVGRRWILWGGVLLVVLAIVLLRIVALFRFLPGRWRGVLVTLLLTLGSMDEGHVVPRNPPLAVGGISEEDRKEDHEAGNRDADAGSDAEPVSADELAESDGGVSGGQAGDRLGKGTDAS